MQRRAWPVAIGVAALLLAAGTPLLSLKLENGGANLLPDSFEAVQLQQNLQVRFPGAGTDPVTVLARATPQQLDAYVAGLGQLLDRADVAAVAPATRLSTSPYASVDITPTGSSQGEAAQRLVHVLREHRPPYQSWVTGDAAVLIDFSGSLAERLPWALGVIAVALFVLLFLMTGSVLVPVKALVMNAISLGATFGALVWVFQQGHLEDAARVHLDRGDRDLGAGDRVRVRVRRSRWTTRCSCSPGSRSSRRGLRPTTTAVRLGLQRTGRIITSAALLIVIVFCGFAAGRMLGDQADRASRSRSRSCVDATLVRCLLVPATMTLLGDWNWWAPAPLRRLHARIGMSDWRCRCGRGGDTGTAPRAPTPSRAWSRRTAAPRSARRPHPRLDRVARLDAAVAPRRQGVGRHGRGPAAVRDGGPCRPGG